MQELATITQDALEFERHYDAAPERVWRALTDPGELRGWLARAEIDLRVGGSIVLTFENDPNVMRGTITELEEGRLLEYTWTEGGTDSVVRFEVTPENAGTRLKLRHSFRRVADITSFGGGWHHHLELLEAQAAGRTRDWDWDRYNELKGEYGKVKAG